MENMCKIKSHIAILGITTILIVFLSYNLQGVNASDPSALQDFCIGVEDPTSAVFVNGLFCKDPKKVTVKDFLLKGFNQTGDTNNLLHVNATLISAEKLPSLNTQGVAIAHIDFGPFGLNTPHHHPRSSEIFVVLTGTLYSGFITSDYKLFSVVLNPGDLFVFPQGLIHFQYNLKKAPARAIASFGSQNPGRVNTPQGLFGTTPEILDDVLTRAYQVDATVIDELRAQFSNAIKGIKITKASDDEELVEDA